LRCGASLIGDGNRLSVRAVDARSKGAQGCALSGSGPVDAADAGIVVSTLVVSRVIAVVATAGSLAMLDLGAAVTGPEPSVERFVAAIRGTGIVVVAGRRLSGEAPFDCVTGFRAVAVLRIIADVVTGEMDYLVEVLIAVVEGTCHRVWDQRRQPGHAAQGDVAGFRAVAVETVVTIGIIWYVKHPEVHVAGIHGAIQSVIEVGLCSVLTSGPAVAPLLSVARV